MGLYLAELAGPEHYDEPSPGARGWLLIYYKKELRWARPCMRFGAFEVPDLNWITRNYKKYHVWVDYEEQNCKASKQEALIWVGFCPVGRAFYPEPAADLKDKYPDVSVAENGAWRLVRNSREGEELYSLYKLDPDGTPHLVLQADGTAQITLLENSVTFTTDDGTYRLAPGADEPFVLGNVLKTKLEALIDAILACTVPTAWGPSGPISAGAGAAQLNTIKAALADILSTFIFGSKDPP